MKDRATVLSIEERGFNSWPALQIVMAEGWILRFAAGHTRRANSVNPIAPVEREFARLVALAEALYTAQGLRAGVSDYAARREHARPRA